MIFTAGTLNLYGKNSFIQVLRDLRKAIKNADVWGMQEHHSKRHKRALRTFLRRRDVEGFIPGGSGHRNPIAWKTKVFEPIEEDRGYLVTHGGRTKFTPDRSLTWQALRHKATGKVVLFVNTHAINGYANNKPGRQEERDALAAHHWLDVLGFFAERLQADDRYDAVVFVGDFNARLENRAEWFYPGPLLEGLFEEDPGAPRSIDRIVTARKFPTTSLRRWSLKVNSDHRLHLRRLKV